MDPKLMEEYTRAVREYQDATKNFENAAIRMERAQIKLSRARAFLFGYFDSRPIAKDEGLYKILPDGDPNRDIT